MTYAGNIDFLKSIAQVRRASMVTTNICEEASIKNLLHGFRPNVIVHFAAESHVDNSINSPDEFIKTNINGTFNLLKLALDYYQNISKDILFLHVSTDEVYGELGDTGKFKETTRYDPRSPYSASKAASDHLVMAFYHTYGLPIKMTNCSNNYGPWQHKEKLIPKVINNILERKPIPVYGRGQNIRDWLYVEDHCKAIELVIQKGTIGESYNIGGDCEISNINLVKEILKNMEYSGPDLIEYVEDRAGHDFRYAIDHSKITKELGWNPLYSFKEGITKTIKWYKEKNNG